MKKKHEIKLAYNNTIHDTTSINRNWTYGAAIKYKSALVDVCISYDYKRGGAEREIFMRTCDENA